jgi:pyridoxamine 5'-phosphate oxidase
MAAPRPETLAEIDTALWRELSRAALDRQHEWHTLVLATVADDGDGPRPDARTVVLREVQAQERRLSVFTDARAAKTAQLRAQPRAMAVLWSRRLGWQLRLQLHCEVQEDGLAVASRWARLKLTRAAQDYLSPLAPGSRLPAGADADGTDDADTATPAGGPPPREPADTRAHFALLSATVQGIDWLELHAEGHRRARFDADGARWLVP